MRRARQNGVILLSALVLVALAAVVAAALFFETAMTVRRTAASFSMEQALALGQGAEALAAYALRDDRNRTDSPDESWAQPYPAVEVAPDISLEAQMIDLQGRFNLNMLVNADGTRNENAMKVFRRLLDLLDQDERWADMVADWIDEDTRPDGNGGEDSLYLSQQPPHRAGNLPMSSISELQQMPGMTLEVYQRLAPHVAALPPSVRTVNVCTADGFVLDALLAASEESSQRVEYSALTAEDMSSRRTSGCFPGRTVLAGNDQAVQAITGERSSWFRLQTWMRIGTAQFALYSLMYRDGSGQVRPVARSLGTE